VQNELSFLTGKNVTIDNISGVEKAVGPLIIGRRTPFEALPFEEFLEGIEHLIDISRNIGTDDAKDFRELAQELSSGIEKALKCTKVDIGIRFDAEKGIFYPSGAKLLDERLENEELRWLSENKYTKVYEPFEKGLQFLLEAKNDSGKLQDVVTDLYEALEAFARIVCKKPRKRLGQLVDVFINELNLNQSYRKILKEYIDYACKFRHPEDDRPNYDYAEVEAFVYLTGLFIRLGIQKLKDS